MMRRATDQTPRIRYVLRLLPKGERTDKRHHYGIGRDGLQLIEQTAHLLCDHSHLQPGEPLPRVQFAPRHLRSHRFEEKMPYIFQYHQQHLDDIAISACLRFLLHGMSFQTSEGAPVILKPHLLRHAFATFTVQVEGLPLDLVAEWLKQKNLEITRYYSKKGQQALAEEHASFIERLATEIHVREAIVRSPEEIRGHSSRSVVVNARLMGGVTTSLIAFGVHQKLQNRKSATRWRKNSAGPKSVSPTTSARVWCWKQKKCVIYSVIARWSYVRWI